MEARLAVMEQLVEKLTPLRWVPSERKTKPSRISSKNQGVTKNPTTMSIMGPEMQGRTATQMEKGRICIMHCITSSERIRRWQGKWAPQRQ